MTLRLDPELATRVEALAEIEELPIAEVIRSALKEHIEQRKQDSEFQSKLRRRLARQAQISELFSNPE
jgi:predicted transcriptional regulator